MYSLLKLFDLRSPLSSAKEGSVPQARGLAHRTMVHSTMQHWGVGVVIHEGLSPYRNGSGVTEM